MAFDPTAFIRAQAPDIVPRGAMSMIQMARQGTQNRLAREQGQRQQGLHGILMQQQQTALSEQQRKIAQSKGLETLGRAAVAAHGSGDQQSYRNNLTQIASIDPKAAMQMASVLGSMDKTSRIEAAHRIFAAASMHGNTQAQNQMLGQALEILGPNDFFNESISNIMALPEGKERDAELFGAVGMAQKLKYLPTGRQDVPKQKTGAFLIKDPETGQTSIATGVFDPISGSLTTETATIDGANVVSKLGETPAEQTERRVGEVGKKATVKGEERRASELITRGIAAAESTATLRRGIDLLEKVKTGGVKAISLRVKQSLGLEGANEGELSNSLGKAVLSQLRETFGAAFTENEGRRLSRIEASFTKSPETNKRLLNQALKIATNTAQRAKAAALRRGDQETVDQIDNLLAFTLTEIEEQKAVTKSRAADEGESGFEPLPPRSTSERINRASPEQLKQESTEDLIRSLLEGS